MENIKRYAKRFVVGIAVGLGVWAFMSTFGLAGLVTFASTNPLVNTVYAGLFFGAIQTSLAIANDLLDPPKKPAETMGKVSSKDTDSLTVEAARTMESVPSPSHEKSHKSHVARLNEETNLDAPLAQAQR
jgi:hypothetical protein